ncbi:hypothetical protein P9112_002980 [Eukaryota sp. TZLM1-RC]
MLNDLICRCGQLNNLNHLFSCKFNIRYRSVDHDAVRDQLYAMYKSHHIEAFVEPLVRKLSHRKCRADLIAPRSNGVIKVVEVVTVDLCKESAIDLAKKDETPLWFAEKSKIKKYNKPSSQPGRVEHAKLQVVPFAVSFFVNIGISGIKFLEVYTWRLPLTKHYVSRRFSRRFPEDSDLLVPSCSPYLSELSCELDRLPPQIWTKCFPQSIQEIPNRSLCILQFCCKKLQQKLSKIFESLDFDVRLGLAKIKNPAFANLLQDMCNNTSSALVKTIPRVYGTLLTDSAWTLNMRFRSFIWPDCLPHNLICKCSREITITHLLNCKHFFTFRSKVHDAEKDQIESFFEPLLSNLFDTEDDVYKNNRGDVILPGLDGSFILLDVMSVDPCYASNERLVNSEIHNPLSNAENFKFKKIQ